MTDWHPLYGPKAILLWFPETKTATAPDFHAHSATESTARIETWWSVRDAIKYAAANPRKGFRPWLFVNAEVFHPDRVISAAAEILKQDHEDASCS